MKFISWPAFLCSLCSCTSLVTNMCTAGACNNVFYPVCTSVQAFYIDACPCLILVKETFLLGSFGCVNISSKFCILNKYLILRLVLNNLFCKLHWACRIVTAWDVVHETERNMLTHPQLWTLSSIVFCCDITSFFFAVSLPSFMFSDCCQSKI